MKLLPPERMRTFQDEISSGDDDISVNTEDPPSQTLGYGDSSTPTDGKGDRSPEQKDGIATKETRAVSWLRGSVVFAILLAAALVSGLVYYLLGKSQENTFLAAFDGEAEKVFAEFT